MIDEVTKQDADLKPLLIDLEAYSGATGGKQAKAVQPERLSGGDDMYCVYWIHTNEHSNFKTEGYIGISKNFKNRMLEHKRNRYNYIINKAISKHGWDNLIKEILFDNLSYANAKDIELDLRREDFIGWNMRSGGMPGIKKEWYDNEDNRKMHSKKTSEATKLAIKKKDSFEARSIRGKVSYEKNRKLFEEMNRGSKNGKAILNESQVYEIRFKLIPNNVKTSIICKMFGIKRNVVFQIRNNITWKHVVCDSPDYE